ncbi:MAG: response regulator [Pseudomonadota bacterium]|nr:response regulator [Pseudomonadota bacterium]
MTRARAPLVLVVEDNAANMALTTTLLEIEQCPFVTAIDIERGEEWLQKVRPSLVLLDIQLPGGGGELLLRSIRAMPELARIPVFAVTALAMDGDRERLLREGFDEYVSKPLDTRAFRALVRRHLDELTAPSAEPG